MTRLEMSPWPLMPTWTHPLALSGGRLEEGLVGLIMGSSTIVIDAVRWPHLDPQRRYLLTPHAEPGWFGRPNPVGSARPRPCRSHQRAARSDGRIWRRWFAPCASASPP